MSHVRNLFRAPSGRTLEVAHQAPGPLPQAAPQPVPVRQENAPEFPTEEARILPEARLVYQTDPRSPGADRFRYLRMLLRDTAKSTKLKKLLVTSPLAGDGKSTVVLNLATALSELGQKNILVVEADLHRASLATDLKLRPWTGLSDCLANDTMSPFSAIRRIEPLGWCLMPAGEPQGNPTEMLQTPAFGTIMERVSESFDWVLIDSPPVLSFTDAISLHQHADGSLLVAKAGITPREAIEKAVALLGPKKVRGVVLNAVSEGSVSREHKDYVATRRDHAE